MFENEIEKYTNGAEYSFDKQTDVLSYIDNQPEKFVYYIRKLKLTIHEFNKSNKQTNLIIKRIKDTQVSNDNKLVYALCLKYLINNSSQGIDLSKHIRCRDIIDLIKLSFDDDGRIQNELVSILDLIASSNVNDSFSQSDLELVLENKAISERTKDLVVQIRKRGTTSSLGNISEKSALKLRHINTSRGKSQLVVTKIIHRIRSSVRTQMKSQEEVGTRYLNLATVIKKSNKNTEIVKLKEENIITRPEIDGSDKTFWSDGFIHAVNLYKLAKQDQTIKKQDKDEFLPDLLLTYILPSFLKEQTHSANIILNRLCAATLCIVSQKQKLNSKAINELMRCVVPWPVLLNLELKHESSFDNLHRLFNYESVSNDSLIQAISTICPIDFFDDLISELKQLKGRDGASERAMSNLIRTFIDKLRLDAVNAIYNSVRRNENVLTTNQMYIIINCFEKLENEEDDAFRRVLCELVNLIDETTPGEIYIKLFESNMNIVRKQSKQDGVLQAVQFIVRQSKDAKRCQKLFTSQVVEDILKIQTKNEDKHSNDINRLKIETVRNYLLHDFSVLSDKSQCCLIQNMFSSANIDIFRLLLLCAGKKITLSIASTDLLIEYLKTHNNDDMLQNYVIVTLSYFGQNSITLRSTEQLQVISKHINSQYMLSNDTIEMVKIDTLPINVNNFPVSLFAVELILSSIEGGIQANNEIIYNLLSTIESANPSKQIAIVAAKCIFNLSLSQTQHWSADILGMIGNRISSDIYGVGVYMKVNN